MTYKQELYNEIQNFLREHPDVLEALGAQPNYRLPMFYRLAPPNQKMPYLTYEVDQEWGPRDRVVGRAKLFLTIWDYDESGLRSSRLASVIEGLLNLKVIHNSDLTACRLYHDYSILYPIPKKDGGVDANIHRIELIFTVRLASKYKLDQLGNS